MKSNHSQESPNIEKSDEMPNYETVDGVVDLRDTRIPSNDKHCLIYPDSLLKTKQDFFDSKEVVYILSE